MQLRDIMNQPVVTCRPGDTLNTAAQLMWENDCGALPAVDEEGKAVGMVTDRDICMAAYTQGKALSDLFVGDTMAHKVIACHVGDSLETAEKVMSDAQIRRVPVVDGDNRPIGVVSLSDIARFTASSKGSNGYDRKLASTLASISKPRPRKAGQQSSQSATAE